MQYGVSRFNSAHTTAPAFCLQEHIWSITYDTWRLVFLDGSWGRLLPKTVMQSAGRFLIFEKGRGKQRLREPKCRWEVGLARMLVDSNSAKMPIANRR